MVLYLAPSWEGCPGVLTSRHCLSRPAMQGEWLTHCTSRSHETYGAKLRPHAARGALGPAKTVSTTRKGLCFCFWATSHNLFGCVSWQLRPRYPSARHCLLLFPIAGGFSSSGPQLQWGLLRAAFPHPQSFLLSILTWSSALFPSIAHE